MIGTLANGLDELYHHATFGEDRTTRADCSYGVVFCSSVTFGGRRAVRSRGA